MSILFDQPQFFYYIYRYYSASGTYSANMTSSTKLNYFNDSAVVGDCLYLGIRSSTSYVNHAHPFHDVVFNVGTALAADSITVVWEYYSSGVWTEIPSVTDGTNAFTTTGVNTVSFPIPPNWYRSNAFFWSSSAAGSINNSSAIWIRCRITAVTNITEGGAQTTDRVYHHDYTITADDETALTLEDIYDADVAGSWGVVTKSESDYVIMANLALTGTTVLTTKNEYLRIGSSDYRYVFGCYDSTASFVMGEKDAGGFGINGSTLTNFTWGMTEGSSIPMSNWKIYGSRVWRSDTGFMGLKPSEGIEILDSVLKSNYFSFGTDIAAGSSIKRTLLDFSYYWYLYSGNLSIDSVSLSNDCDGILCGRDATISNMDFTSSQKVMRYYSANITLINCTGITNANIAMRNSPTTGGGAYYVYKKYHLDLTVQDSGGNALSGARVYIRDSDGAEVADLTTDENGQITQQTIEAYRKWIVEAEAWAIHEKTYSPHTITISKSGYQTKTVIYTMDRKREEVETLEEQVPVFVSSGGKVLINENPADGQNEVAIDENYK